MAWEQNILCAQAGESGGGEVGDHTNSSLRLMRWLRDYGELMRRIPPTT